MRLDQQTDVYRRKESEGDYDLCWEQLLQTLRKYTISPSAARRKAQLPGPRRPLRRRKGMRWVGPS